MTSYIMYVHKRQRGRTALFGRAPPFAEAAEGRILYGWSKNKNPMKFE